MSNQYLEEDTEDKIYEIESRLDDLEEGKDTFADQIIRYIMFGLTIGFIVICSDQLKDLKNKINYQNDRINLLESTLKQ